MSRPASLRRKLFLARKAAEGVEKRGAAEGFNYARAEDVLEEASRQLEKRGILVVPSMVDEELILGKAGVLAKAVISYEVTDTESGESLTVRWAGTGHDSPGDKAIFKATTGTTKYFLANLLGIPFGTDPEAEVAPEETTGCGEAAEVTDMQDARNAQLARERQDADAEAPDLPRHRQPLPVSDIPEPDWTGLGREEAARA